MKDLVGQRFGALIVVSFGGREGVNGRYYYWNCVCDCGGELRTRSDTLSSGRSKSCHKCFKGLDRHPLYHVWSAMKNRCYSEKNKQYKDYGGRGIKVCDEWNDKNFISFYNWAIKNGYREGLCIDRKENDGDYEPSNCKFVTYDTNLLNRRNTIWLDYRGEKVLLRDLARNNNIKSSTIMKRIRKHGWSVEKAVETAVKL